MALTDSVFGLVVSLVFLILPGFFVSKAVFSENKEKKQSIHEKALFSVLFSITIVPFLILIQNSFFSVSIDLTAIVITGLAVMIASYVISVHKTKNIFGGFLAFRK